MTKLISEPKLDHIIRPGLVASLSSLTPGVQNFFSGMHFLSWFTSSEIILVIVVTLICYCRACMKRNNNSYMNMTPVRYEANHGKIGSDKVKINLDRMNVTDERNEIAKVKHDETLLTPIRPKIKIDDRDRKKVNTIESKI